MGTRCHILIVPTRPFWFSEVFSQTIVRLGLKLCGNLRNNVLISLMTLQKLKLEIYGNCSYFVSVIFKITVGLPGADRTSNQDGCCRLENLKSTIRDMLRSWLLVYLVEYGS